MKTPPNEMAFPLRWPPGWDRAATRERAAFHRFANGGRRQLTIGEGRDRLLHELDMHGAANIVISSNAPLRNDGQLRADANNPHDPGAAVYFYLPDRLGDLRPYALAVDRWDRLADNLAALAAHVEAMRGMERWGVGSMDRTFAGYKALAAMPERQPWWQVLGFDVQPRSLSTVEARWRELVRRHHPDRGGNSNDAAEVNAAWQEAKEALGA